MDKKEFLERLRAGLSGLSQSDIESHVSFYSEMIDDRIEEGMSEQEAVRQIGSVDEIVSQILSEYSISTLLKQKIKSKKQLKPWHIVLIVLGSPIWISIIATVLVLAVSFYVSIWTVVISLWAVFSSFIAVGAGVLLYSVICFVQANTHLGIVSIGAALIFVGASFYLFYASKLITKFVIFITKRVFLFVKRQFV